MRLPRPPGRVGNPKPGRERRGPGAGERFCDLIETSRDRPEGAGQLSQRIGVDRDEPAGADVDVVAHPAASMSARSAA